MFDILGLGGVVQHFGRVTASGQEIIHPIKTKLVAFKNDDVPHCELMGVSEVLVWE